MTTPKGHLVLDRNPENCFAEVKQAAFEPAETVPGIGFSPEKTLLGRLFFCTGNAFPAEVHPDRPVRPRAARAVRQQEAAQEWAELGPYA